MIRTMKLFTPLIPFSKIEATVASFDSNVAQAQFDPRKAFWWGVVSLGFALLAASMFYKAYPYTEHIFLGAVFSALVSMLTGYLGQQYAWEDRKLVVQLPIVSMFIALVVAISSLAISCSWP
jgi:hypothetical protein